MFRPSLSLNVALPATSANAKSRAPKSAARAGDGAPFRFRFRRRPRGVGVALVLVLCGLVAFAGWILSRGSPELGPSGPANRSGVACEPSSCVVIWGPTQNPLPPEWQWGGRIYSFDAMYRGTPSTSQLAALEPANREEREARARPR